MEGIGQLTGQQIPPHVDLFHLNTDNKDKDKYEAPQYVTIRPLDAIRDDGPYLFELWSTRLIYLLKTLRVVMEVSLTNDNNTLDGESFTNTHDDEISVCNSFAHACFGEIGTELCGVPISDHSRHYGTRSHILQKFSLTKDVKQNNLNCEYWAHDSDTLSTKTDNKCIGFKARKEVFKQSNIVQIVFCPILDFSASQQNLAPGHSLKLKFERSRDSFSLLCTNPSLRPKIKMHNIYLTVRCAVPNTMFLQSIKKQMSTKKVPYDVTRNVIRTFVHSKGVTDISVANIYRGKLPRSCYFYMLNNEQTGGSYGSNPHVFKHYDLREASVNINGTQIPGRPVQIDHSKKFINEAYRFMLDNIGELIHITILLVLSNYFFSRSC